MKKTNVYIMFAFAVVFALVFELSDTYAASFDCGKAGNTLEKTICNNPALNDADTQLGRVYSDLRKSQSASEVKKLKKEQKAWLKKRTVLCKSGDAACLLSVYENRLAELKALSSGKKGHHSQAKTRLDINDGENSEYKKADNELNRVYQAVLRKYKDDDMFVRKFKQAQKTWIKFRDAEMEAIFPHHETPHYYGSVFPMCWSQHLTRLTQERTRQLKVWLDGVEEGDACSGSY